MISSNIALVGNLSSSCSSGSSADLLLLKRFKVYNKQNKVQSIKEVIWKAPSYNWIKCNTDGAAKGTPGVVACGGIFRDKSAAALGCFALNIGSSYAFNAELLGVLWRWKLLIRKVGIDFGLSAISCL